MDDKLKETFDLVIIGGGAAGFAAATKADELGIETAIINAGLPMGGTCVNVGCIPTKHLLGIGKELYSLRHPKLNSISPIEPNVNFSKIMEQKENLVNVLRQRNYQDVLNSFKHVTWIEGRGAFKSKHIISIGDQLIKGDKILIATGCFSRIPPIEGLSDTKYITNRETLFLEKQPSSLAVLGGGPLGLEFAQIFSRIGTKVTLMIRGNRILSREEPEISESLKKYLMEENIDILNNVQISKVTNTGNEKKVIFEKGGKIEAIIANDILVAAGVLGNIQGMGLDKVGIETENDCHVKVNEFLQTNIPHIYAAGDCICHKCLETVAAKEGKIAVENAFENSGRSIDYSSIPYAVFTDPEVACVGLTEAKYMEIYNTCDCRTVYMDRIPKALAINDTRGLLKMVVHHETKKIMGVHILSSVATEMIHEATLAIKFGLTVDDIIDTVHVFPTYSEAIKIAAQAFRRDIGIMSCCVE